MRSAQVYRWQIPMDAGVVLRDRRLKTRDGLYVCLREGEREGWGEISPLPGFSQETWEDAQSVLLAWVNNWLAPHNRRSCSIPSPHTWASASIHIKFTLQPCGRYVLHILPLLV